MGARNARTGPQTRRIVPSLVAACVAALVLPVRATEPEGGGDSAAVPKTPVIPLDSATPGLSVTVRVPASSRCPRSGSPTMG